MGNTAGAKIRSGKIRAWWLKLPRSVWPPPAVMGAVLAGRSRASPSRRPCAHRRPSWTRLRRNALVGAAASYERYRSGERGPGADPPEQQERSCGTSANARPKSEWAGAVVRPAGDSGAKMADGRARDTRKLTSKNRPRGGRHGIRPRVNTGTETRASGAAGGVAVARADAGYRPKCSRIARTFSSDCPVVLTELLGPLG